MNSSQALPGDAAPRRSSIVAHPWFPKMIGLWFAALFGLCSLALAPEMLERIVSTLGIDRIVPAAAPPLGPTARLLLALGMAGVGEIAGLVIGTRLATGNRMGDSTEDAPHLRGRDRHPDAPARKPLSADDLVENLGGEQVREAEQPVAPEPASLDARDLAEPFDVTTFDAPQEEDTVAPFLAPLDPVVAPVAPREPDPLPPREAAFSALVAAAPSGAIVSAPLEALGVVQLSERLALALQARRERRLVSPVAVEVAPAAVAATDAPVAIEPRLEILARRAPKVGEHDVPVEDGDSDEAEELTDETLEEGYSSLLAMGSGFQRPEAVRIEEPQSDAIEQVVIFPGQGARGGCEASNTPGASLDAPLARPDTTPAATDARASGKPATPVEPDEADRALRAALASLQRISGAR